MFETRWTEFEVRFNDFLSYLAWKMRPGDQFLHFDRRFIQRTRVINVQRCKNFFHLMADTCCVQEMEVCLGGEDKSRGYRQTGPGHFSYNFPFGSHATAF